MTAPERAGELPPELEGLARWLDESITLPGGYKIGWDGIIGLIPGIGDVAGFLASAYIVLRGMQLGVRKRAVARMLGNVGIEALVGMIPVLGDWFDFVFKANKKNLIILKEELSLRRPRVPRDSEP